MAGTLEESINNYNSERTQYCCFAVNSSLNLYNFASLLGDYFHCDFSSTSPIQFLPDALKAKFNVLYTQLFASQLYESRQSTISDKITIVIFENKTLEYDADAYQRSAENALDLFSDNTHNYYFAFNSVTPCFRKLDFDNAHFLVMIYAMKNQNINDALNYLAQFPNEKMKSINIIRLQTKIPQSFIALKSLFIQLEIKINLDSTYRALHFLHKHNVANGRNEEVGLLQPVEVLPATLNKYVYLYNENEIY